MTPEWFNFTLGFAAEGPDDDTVRCTLGLRPGWVIRVDQFDETGLDRVVHDIVFDDLVQDDDPANGWPMFIVGHRYLDEQAADGSLICEPVRIPLAGAKITVY
jgi:hypothetical protein